MKLLWVMLDGLEAALVEQMRLGNLLLDRHGTVHIPEEFYNPEEGIPFTPKVWGTMLTGKPPEVHGATQLWRYGRVLEFVRRLPVIRWIRGKRKILIKLGIYPKRRYFRLSGPTVLDECGPSVAVNVAGVNLWEDEMSEIANLIAAGRLDKAVKRSNDYMVRVFKRFEEEALSREWKLAAVYVPATDTVAHICWGRCPGKVRATYRLADMWVGRLRRRLAPDATLVVSDHGATLSDDGVSGTHSDYMFWATDVEGVEIRSPYDVYRVVKAICSGEL